MENNMKIDIYQSNKDHSKYLSVPVDTDINTLANSFSAKSDFRSLTLFKKAHEIQSDKPYIALDVKDIINQINEHGYAIHGAEISIEEG